MIRAVAFDLDDTLFLERDYVRSGFRAVDAYLKQHVDGGRDWFGMLWSGFEAGVRGDAFNRVLAAAGCEAAPARIAEMVTVYREHRPDIRPMDDVARAIDSLGLPAERLGVITDGPVAMQRAKFEALGLGGRLRQVIYTDEWGVAYRKPHPRAYAEFERRTGCSGAECAYVSDNPAKDFAAPHGRGWRTVRVIRRGGLHAAEASAPGEVDAEIESLAELKSALEQSEP